MPKCCMHQRRVSNINYEHSKPSLFLLFCLFHDLLRNGYHNRVKFKRKIPGTEERRPRVRVKCEDQSQGASPRIYFWHRSNLKEALHASYIVSYKMQNVEKLLWITIKEPF